MRKLFNDENGFVISAELVLVLTIAVLAMVVGLASVRDSVLAELNDIAHAFGSINQSYSFRSVVASNSTGSTNHAAASGAGYRDLADDCDCQNLQFTEVCGKLQTGTGAPNEGN